MSDAAVRLTVTATGEVTFDRSVLQHLGVGAGDTVLVDLMPGGTLQLRAAPRQGIEAFFGSLAREGGPALSIEEMNEAIAAGWAGER